jgi:hypothetical protein
MRHKLRSHLTFANVVSMLALSVALGGTTYAATGGNFILGQSNSTTSTTGLSAGVTGPALRVTNTSTGTAAGFNVSAGHPPFNVNSGTKVAKLNADLLDGADSSAFLPRSKVKWARVELNGTLGAHSGVTTVNRYQQGGYRVTFDQDVSSCAYSATPAKDVPAIGALSDAPDNPNDVLVVISDGVNTVDMDFSVEAFC